MTSAPTVPTFVQGESGVANIQNLQSLANCVAFLTNMDYGPGFHLTRSSAFSLPNSAVTAIPFPVQSYDPVPSSDGTGAVLYVPGIYQFKAVVPVSCNANSLALEIMFEFTAGTNNPNFSSGTFQHFGGDATISANAANTDTCFTLESACPFDIYSGDEVKVLGSNQSSTTVSTSYNTNTNAWQGRWVPSFQGRWIRNTH